MKKSLNLKDEWFENTCIKCGAMYQGIQECPMCDITKNGTKCKICWVKYTGDECPFKERHHRYTLFYRVKRRILYLFNR